jgi:hypothetical protein
VLNVFISLDSIISAFQHNTKYYYRIGSGDSSREFWFETPPKVDADAPYKFGIIGMLSVSPHIFFY